jgi:mRNA interferase MazF
MVKQGDIIKLNLDPTMGSEQAGYRPALVITAEVLSRFSNLTILCPITNTDRGSYMHVRLTGITTTGVVMCDQIRAIDLRARDYKLIDKIAVEDMKIVCKRLSKLVEFDYL